MNIDSGDEDGFEDNEDGDDDQDIVYETKGTMKTLSEE